MIRVSLPEHLYYPNYLFVLQLLTQIHKVELAVPPKLDFLQRAVLIRVVLVYLNIKHVLDLLSPIHQNGFQTLKKILVFNRVQICLVTGLEEGIVGDVEIGCFFETTPHFIGIGEEFVRGNQELFLDIFGPAFVLENFLDEVLRNVVYQTDQDLVLIDALGNDLLVEIRLADGLLTQFGQVEDLAIQILFWLLKVFNLGNLRRVL